MKKIPYVDSITPWSAISLSQCWEAGSWRGERSVFRPAGQPRQAAGPIVHTSTTAAPWERLAKNLYENEFLDIMSALSAAGVKKKKELDKNSMRASQKMHRNFLYANSQWVTELNWQHQFSETPPYLWYLSLSSVYYPLFPFIHSFPPPYFFFCFLSLSCCFPRMLYFIFFFNLAASIILNFAVELIAISPAVGLVVDALSSNQHVPLDLSPDKANQEPVLLAKARRKMNWSIWPLQSINKWRVEHKIEHKSISEDGWD